MSYLWITFSYDSAKLTGSTLVELRKVIDAVRTHSREYWAFDYEQEFDIKAIKIDMTVDMSGSFFTNDYSDASDTLQELIGEQVSQIFYWDGSNFLDLRPLIGLTTVKGSNNLSSCF